MAQWQSPRQSRPKRLISEPLQQSRVAESSSRAGRIGIHGGRGRLRLGAKRGEGRGAQIGENYPCFLLCAGPNPTSKQAQRPLSSSSCFTILHCQNKLLELPLDRDWGASSRNLTLALWCALSRSPARIRVPPSFAVMAIVMELGRDEITAASTDGGQREMGPHRARSPPFSARGNEETAAERRGNIWRLNYNLGIISQCIARSVVSLLEPRLL